jgi:hypothetical protein
MIKPTTESSGKFLCRTNRRGNWDKTKNQCLTSESLSAFSRACSAPSELTGVASMAAAGPPDGQGWDKLLQTLGDLRNELNCCIWFVIRVSGLTVLSG